MINIQEVFQQQRGLRSKVAQALGITHGAVSQWKKVPPERVIEVEHLTGISRYELRPDIYGKMPPKKKGDAV